VTDQTPAQELRAAAEKLRAAAVETAHRAPGPWRVHEAYGFLRVDNDRDKTREAWTMKTGADLAEENRATAEYIALLHPGVGLAVARWLDSLAGVEVSEHGPMAEEYPHALAVARALLGGDQ
jgi:hypothetical protein